MCEFTKSEKSQDAEYTPTIFGTLAFTDPHTHSQVQPQICLGVEHWGGNTSTIRHHKNIMKLPPLINLMFTKIFPAVPPVPE
jgi:hypothetical protein